MNTASDAVSMAVSNLYLKHPFYGQMLMSLDIEVFDKHDPRSAFIDTAATDGNKVFVFDDFITNDLKSQVAPTMFVLAHEVEHIVRLHALRVGAKDRRLYNSAADHRINLDLLSTGLKGPVDSEGNFLGLADEKYTDGDWSTERIYRDIETNRDSDDGGGDGNDGDDGDGARDVFAGDVLEPRNADGSRMSEQQRSDLDRDMRSKILAAAARVKAMHGIGSIPAHLRETLDAMTKSKVRWADVLRDYFTAKIRGKESWNQLDRRLRPLGMRLPTQETTALGGVGIIIDTSGSCYAQIPAFIGELAAIVSDTEPKFVRTIFVDTQIQVDRSTTFSEFEDDMADVLKSPPRGGGTDLRPAFDALEHYDEGEVDVVVCLTDMATPWPESFSLAAHTVFVDSDAGAYAKEPPFGRKIDLIDD